MLAKRLQRIDTQASKAKGVKLGRQLEAPEKVKRLVWTQGDPPAYSFDRGHVFHELRESAAGVRRSIVILLSRPDPGALVMATVSDSEGTEEPIVAESTSESTTIGFVDYEILSYLRGVLTTDEKGIAIKERSSRTQLGFAEFLRTGR